MEHDDEMRIREKVQVYDQVPSALNKDRLWSSLILPGSQSRSSGKIAIYYAAASLLLATAIAVYSFELTRRKELDLRLAEIELLLKSSQSPMPAAMNPIAQELVCPEGVSTFSQERLTAQRSKPMKAIKANPTDPVPSDPTESSVTAIAAPPHEVIAAVHETTNIKDEPAVTEVPPPLTILGKSIPSNTGKKQERLTFRLFNDEYNKSQAPASPAPVVILAGINN